MNEEEIQEMLDYIQSIYDKDGVANEKQVLYKYGDEKVNELFERGLIYAPVMGRLRVI